MPEIFFTLGQNTIFGLLIDQLTATETLCALEKDSGIIKRLHTRSTVTASMDQDDNDRLDQIGKSSDPIVFNEIVIDLGIMGNGHHPDEDQSVWVDGQDSANPANGGGRERVVRQEAHWNNGRRPNVRREAYGRDPDLRGVSGVWRQISTLLNWSWKLFNIGLAWLSASKQSNQLDWTSMFIPDEERYSEHQGAFRPRVRLYDDE